jgi:hypothetical protein
VKRSFVLRSRRAQFEILGLAFLIIIVVLGALVFFMLSRQARTSDAVASYENDQLAQSVIDTMLRANAGPACENQPSATLYDLIRDITIVKRGLCDGIVDVNGVPTRSVDVLERAVTIIVGNATGVRGDFFLYLKSNEEEKLVSVVNCPTGSRVVRDRIGSQEIRLLPTPETAVIELQLCPGA